MDDLMLQEFLVEAEELYSEAENALLSFEKSNDKHSSFNAIFRCFHSVKGAAGMFGLVSLQEHMHILENIFEKKDPDNLSNVDVDYFLQGIDVAKKIMLGQNISFDYSALDAKTDIKSEIKPEINKRDELPTSPSDDLINDLKKYIFTSNISVIYEGNVIVVDDEPGILEVIESILKSKNYKVRCFTNVKDALVAIEEKCPDAVITDLKMPEINGIEFMKKVNKKYPNLPFIMVSGFVTKDVCLEALCCGVMGVIEKPIDIDLLLSQLQLAINRYTPYVLFKKSLDMHVSEFERYDQYLKVNNETIVRDSFRKNLRYLLLKKKIIDSGWVNNGK